jgi:hypothetical protein
MQATFDAFVGYAWIISLRAAAGNPPRIARPKKLMTSSA